MHRNTNVKLNEVETVTRNRTAKQVCRCTEKIPVGSTSLLSSFIYGPETTPGHFIHVDMSPWAEKVSKEKKLFHFDEKKR